MSVQAWEDGLQLKTYLLGPEDPLPHWERTGMRRIYPYPMQDDLSDEVRDISYRALHIENEYLHCIVLPQFGGHLYSLYDKVAGREVFYRNNVVKYGLVARRGAWISGGIEFNFPQGHTCVTVSPVASHLAEDQESGAASITVGTTDLVSRMRWSVKLSLAPGEARLRQDVMLHNPTPIRQRHYFWANSAVPARDDLRLVYPATKCRTLGGEQPYPIVNGRDMSLYRSHEVPNDIFALDVTDDFFGCYYEELDVGLVHWSDHRLNFGKKFFTWGTADEGMIWVDLLTDEDGQYVELQSGRFVDQSTFEFLYPYQCVRWTEYWYPIHGMGGWSRADDRMALRLEPGDDCVHVAALANVDIGPKDLLLQIGSEDVWRQPCELKPGQPVVHEVPFPTQQDELPDLSLHLTDPGGWVSRRPFQSLARVDRQWVDIPKPTLKSADDPEVTPRELLSHARSAEKLSDSDRADTLYDRALAADPSLTEAHVGLALNEYRRWQVHEAIARLEGAAAANPECDEALYYLGMFYADHGDEYLARDAFTRVAGRGACRSEAIIGLARLEMRTAPARARELLNDVPDSPTARFLRALTWRLEGAGLPDGAEGWAEEDPLCPFMAAEAVLQQGRAGEPAADQAVERLLRVVGDDPDLWLELAAEYDRLRLREDTLALLTVGAERVERVRAAPMVAYWQACLERGRRSRMGTIHDATALDPDYCFPGRRDDIGVLNAALHDDPSDWKALLYRGSILAAVGDRDLALASWKAAVEINDQNPVLCRNLGLAYHLWEEDHATALEWYDKAVERRPGEYRLYIERDAVLSASGGGAEPRLAALEAAPERWEIAARRTECLVQLKRWDEALEVMRRHKFRPWEGARHMHALWTEALVGRAAARREAGDLEGALADYELALTYPRNLGVGRAAYPQEAEVHWLAAEVAGELGDDNRRGEHLEAAAGERHRRVCEADLYKLRALRELGRDDEANDLASTLREWAEQRQQTRPEDALAKRIAEEVG